MSTQSIPNGRGPRPPRRANTGISLDLDQFNEPFKVLFRKVKEEMSTSWAVAADGILIFTGLFLSTVASFLVVSYTKLSPDNGETTVILLGWISRQLAEISNGTAPASPFQLPEGSDIFTFKPSWSAIVVNVLWAASLSITVACALLAIFLKRWTHKYGIQRSDNDREAQTSGSERIVDTLTAAILPIMLHLAILLFFVGFVVVLFTNHIVSYTVIGVLVFCTFVYLFFISRSPHRGGD